MSDMPGDAVVEGVAPPAEAAPHARLRSLRVVLPIAAAAIVVDQLTKHWALNELGDGRRIELFWTLRFNLAYNSGMAFSRGDGFGPLIGALALVVVVVLVVSARSSTRLLGSLAVGLIAGGAAGNLTDRLFRDDGWLRGAVIDFIDLQWWPIFNVADMCVTIGGVLFAINAWRAQQPA